VIHVSIIDSYPVFALGLSQCIEGSVDITVQSRVLTIEDYEAKVTRTPDVLILGLESERRGVAGIAAVEHLIAKRLTVLVMAAKPHPRLVVRTLSAGAKGFLPKSIDPSVVPTAIRVLVGGERFIAPSLASDVLQAVVENRRVNVTSREEEVLRLLGMALTDAEIAEELHLSIRSVRSHLERIRSKTGRRRRADLTRLAFDLGLLD
jgi:DNA-binding NarL/FixJ family response regulator